jgi:PTH1 family peptidyl-tRNA hydrolase
MNESGGPTKSLADYFKVKPDHVIAIHDELDIPFESIRLKFGGGDNGHNGLKSITSAFGSEYFRIRMGIGRPVGAQDPADFVLKPFNSQERNSLEDFIAKGASAVESLISDGLDIAQTRFNS